MKLKKIKRMTKVIRETAPNIWRESVTGTKVDLNNTALSHQTNTQHFNI